MKQAILPLDLSAKKTRKQVFLEKMNQVVPWTALVELIAPYYPEGNPVRPPFSLATMLRIHLQSSSGSHFLIQSCKRYSLTPRYTSSLPSWKSLTACPMNRDRLSEPDQSSTVTLSPNVCNSTLKLMWHAKAGRDIGRFCCISGFGLKRVTRLGW